MTELLEAGTEATVCQMPSGSQMNGTRGVIVCYNPSNERYTFELADGQMMSLRAKNLKSFQQGGKDEVKVESVDEFSMSFDGSVISSANQAKDVVADNESINSAVTSALPKVKSTTEAKDVVIDNESISDLLEVKPKQTPSIPLRLDDLVIHTDRTGKDHTAVVLEISMVGGVAKYLIRLRNGVELLASKESLRHFKNPNNQTTYHTEEERSEDYRPVQKSNPLDNFLFQVYKATTGFLGSLSPSTIFVALFAIYVFVNWSNPVSNNTNNNGSFDYPSPPPRYWGWWHYGWYGYGWYGIGGLGSFLLAGFLLRKIGTNNGRRVFRWDRVWDGLMKMDIWELIRLAAIFEIALHFLGAVNAGGRRRY
mmetsp:Transcript_13183/g.20098  ORF Transcript_13183/g.20098 Transcript_13183/m.20098 type:complete len:366 (+) Transcript_13183:61-1158(+)|eukprot:CAMPEP_0178916836 /NCGR_PEP_ID=MMETSP0786-20121207/12889_1 /TAXON_ID=186022 /ORGANISM="Thalassionema frauenfeldii, Strain CCMP 1798" /LENGTH=365 /DNA_ID=CAMNT_0020590273 /DNA_START=23 /DNA_END=1120 /DNA_ORIENTATION=-